MCLGTMHTLRSFSPSSACRSPAARLNAMPFLMNEQRGTKTLSRRFNHKPAWPHTEPLIISSLSSGFRERSFAQISRKRRKTRLLSRTCEVTRFYREHQDSRDCTAERPHEKALLFVKGANVTQRHQHTGEKRRGSLQPYLPARLQGALASDTAACNTNQSAFWTSEMYVNESNEWQAWDVADG